LSVWNCAEVPYDQRLLFYIAHDDYRPAEPNYKGHWVQESHVEGFEYSDQYHGIAAVARNDERARLLNPDNLELLKLAEDILAVKTTWERLQKRTGGYSCGIEYTANELTGVKQR
jgi:hypothetical protein